ncbi:SAV_915 family protein [Streptomyces sp. NPDC021093]|uniref:SAV_915 family protein n=1 Tax=Streptomyces sp. NPDC021093 TaxID=3365112 RepID=UPI003798E451
MPEVPKRRDSGRRADNAESEKPDMSTSCAPLPTMPLPSGRRKPRQVRCGTARAYGPPNDAPPGAPSLPRHRTRRAAPAVTEKAGACCRKYRTWRNASSPTDHFTDEPGGRGPAGPLFVPLRPGSASCPARFFRTPPGVRTAVGFTSEERLTVTLGAGRPWIRLSEPALRALTAPLGVHYVTVDPQSATPALSASRPNPRTAPSYGPVAADSSAVRPIPEDSWRDGDPQPAGVLRVTCGAAVLSCVKLLTG